ncbi:MAG: fibrobacter succinogenes major paralogous domain-containing protein [Bacteroidales bacterium]|nr:fibrobacter succinogenes major paralogous domain-containing protein [Bacteroidales bacterium]
MIKIYFKSFFFFLVFLCSCDDDSNEKKIVPEIMFNASLSYDSLSDIDGNYYKTIQIGTQTWMAENLQTTKYNDGTPIVLITNNDEWTETHIGAYCWYDNDENIYKDVYGALYNFYTVESKKLCPVGWHVPTMIEWDTLLNHLENSEISTTLREEGGLHWNNSSIYSGTNESGFTALPSGYRKGIGENDFESMGKHAAWWVDSTFSEDDSFAWSFQLNYYPNYPYPWIADIKKNGYSVRCIKD